MKTNNKLLRAGLIATITIGSIGYAAGLASMVILMNKGHPNKKIQTGNYHGYEACAGLRDDNTKVVGLHTQLRDVQGSSYFEVIEAVDDNHDAIFQQNEIYKSTHRYSPQKEIVDKIEENTDFYVYANPDSLEKVFESVYGEK